jgi:hypothetical protein
MRKHSNVKNIIIVILIILLFLTFFNPGGYIPMRNKYVPQIDSIPYAVHDTLLVESLVEVEVPYELEAELEEAYKTIRTLKSTINEVQITQPVDTMEILKVFYSKNIQKNVLNLPNNVGTITLIDTISQNKVVGRSFDSKIKKQIVRDTLRLPEEKKNKVYFGLNTQVNNPNLVNALGVGFLYQTKEDKIFKIGIGVNNSVIDGTNGTFIPYVDAGIYWKIKVRR